MRVRVRLHVARHASAPFLSLPSANALAHTLYHTTTRATLPLTAGPAQREPVPAQREPTPAADDPEDDASPSKSARDRVTQFQQKAGTNPDPSNAESRMRSVTLPAKVCGALRSAERATTMI